MEPRPEDSMYIYTAVDPVLVGAIWGYLLSEFPYYNTSFHSYSGCGLLGRCFSSVCPRSFYSNKSVGCLSAATTRPLFFRNYQYKLCLSEKFCRPLLRDSETLGHCVSCRHH